MSICLHINEHGKSWPGIRTICEETGYESATVVAAIRKLKEIGLVRVTPRKRSETTIYEPMLAAFGKSNPKVFRKSKHPGVSESETQVFQKVKHGVSETETKEEPKKKNQQEEPMGADAHALVPPGGESEATSPRRRRDPFEIEADFEARRAQGRAAGLDRAAAAHPLAGRWPHLVDLARSFEDANGTRLADLPKSQVPLWAKQLEGHYQADLTPDDERELVRLAKAKKWDLYSPGSADKLIGHLRRKSATLSEPTYAKPSF
jgi:DNA-binding transcriptional MocR family regulator